MTEMIRDLAQLAVPVFVVTSLFNVGLTQHPTRILSHLRNWHYLVRMLVVNLLVVPALMLLAVRLVDLDPVLAAGLLLFGMCAGAPFLIKLTATSQNDIALGATVLMVLMLATVVTLPVMLLRLIDGVSVDALAVAWALVRQMVVPMVVGMFVRQRLSGLAGVVQPWVARISNIALWTIIAATLVGYAGEMADPQLWAAVGTGLLVLLVAFGVGYMMGDGQANLKTVGGLSTAQRGTAAAMIVASQNVTDPRVFLVVNLVNVLGIVALIAIAKSLSRDNRVMPLDTLGADMPGRRASVG